MKKQNFKNITYFVLCVYTVHTHTDTHIYLCVQNLQGHRNIGCSFHWTEQKRISQSSSFQFLNSLFIQRWTIWILLQAIPVLIREQTITLSHYYIKPFFFQSLYLPVPNKPFKKLDSSWKIMCFLVESIWSNVIFLCTALMFQKVWEACFSRNMLPSALIDNQV